MAEGVLHFESPQSPPLRVILYHPEIPQNTGNIARTCAATHTPLHLVEPLGFEISDKYLKRAGLDYWPHVDLKIHPDLDSLRRECPQNRWVYFSVHGTRLYSDYRFQPGDCLVFGPETSGLPDSMLDRAGDRTLRIPIDQSRVRSLNLATTVAVALFEGFRQMGTGFGESPDESRCAGFSRG
jgi:tRNA (cytidine/uridine-2'-O-)-methyltransferase